MTGDHPGGVGFQRRATLRIKVVNRPYEADDALLHQVFAPNAAASREEPIGDLLDEGPVRIDEALTRTRAVGVPVRRPRFGCLVG